MIGLLKKDLLMAKSNLKIMGIVFIAILVLFANEQKNAYFVPCFISLSVMFSTFSYDEFNKTNAYIATFPNGRKNYIIAKYLSTMLVVIACLLISVILSIGIEVYNNNLNISEIIVSTISCSAAIITLIAFFYPAIFKFGIEKSRIGLFVAVFAIIGSVAILSHIFPHIPISTSIENFFNNNGLVIISIISIIAIFISYKISKRIISKKEF